MTIRLYWLLLAGLLFMTAVDAAEPSAAEALIAPGRVTLGISLDDLKAARPKAFDGPEAFRPNDSQQRKWLTMMEVIDLGLPSQVSFWYLFSNNKLSGLLRTRNLVQVSPEGRNIEASSAYGALTRLLGEPRQESLLRKGDSSFVAVRADVWADEEAQLNFYFIATTKEITTAVVAPSDFPMEQVMIHPDLNRFEVEDKAAQTVADLPRLQAQSGEAVPSINKVPSLLSPSLPQPKLAKPTLSVDTPKADQSKGKMWPFGLWALAIAITLGGLWMAWRATSKSHQC